MKETISRREALVLVAQTAALGLLHRHLPEGSAFQETKVRFPPVIRAAIVGLEGHYSEILEAAKTVPQLQVAAIAEKSDRLLQRVSKTALLRNAKIYSDYSKMLDVEKLDVVAVCGENSTRATIVQACAERKISIAAEKPIAMDLKELEATRKKILSYRVPFTMLLPMRFNPEYQAMRSIVQSGQIGEVVAMGAQKSYKLGDRPDWMKSRQTYGGTIPYIGIHMVDLMRWISGRELIEGAAFQSNIGAPQVGEMENNVAIIYRLDNRGTASLRMDYLRPETAPTHGDDRLRIVGTKGIVEYQQENGLTLVTMTQKPVVVKDLPSARLLFVDFLESIYGGKSHLITPDEIFRVNEIVLKTREAAESGRIVKV